METKIIALLGTAISFFLIGCILFPSPPPLSSGIPSDLAITSSYGACHAEWGRTNIHIDAYGNGIYESGRGSMIDDRFAEEEFRKTFTLNENELLALLNQIEESGFYSLQDDYTNLEVRDGGCRFISVIRNNVTKFVSVSNTEAPAAYSQAADAIYAVAEAGTATT